MSVSPQQPICLSIAGLDPSGGAGVLADIKTFSAFGCFGAAAVTSITFQNTVGVFGAVHQSGETVRQQLEPLFDDYQVAAIKTGMLPSAEVIEAIAGVLKKLKPRPPIVVDPVVRSTSGFDLIDDDALRSLIETLFPLAAVVTPNITEAERISEIKIASVEDIASAGEKIVSLRAAAVLIKGGHLGSNGKAIDHLFSRFGKEDFEADFLRSNATHGTGCTLAAGIAANLSLGNDLPRSITISKRFVTEAIRTSPQIGKGHPPVNHLAKT